MPDSCEVKQKFSQELDLRQDAEENRGIALKIITEAKDGIAVWID